jgi:hypothetical protein
MRIQFVLVVCTVQKLRTEQKLGLKPWIVQISHETARSCQRAWDGFDTQQSSQYIHF